MDFASKPEGGNSRRCVFLTKVSKCRSCIRLRLLVMPFTVPRNIASVLLTTLLIKSKIRVHDILFEQVNY